MKVKFGIIGTGFIADAFVRDADLIDTCDIVAVTSRTKEKGQFFASRHAIEQVYDDYDKMLESDIDAVYIATPHVYHHEHTMRALKSKKAVLCEKPFAISSNEAKEMIDTAREEGVLLMEGMWSRFFPAYQKMKLMLDKLGQILFIKADFGSRNVDSETVAGRLYDPNLAGGALLDVGIYPISIVRDIMGSDPVSIKCTQMMNEEGIDLMSTYNYMFKNGALATLYSAITVKTQTELYVSGSEGTLHMPNFFCPEHLIYTRHDGYQEAYNYPKVGLGYTYEIDHFCDLLIKGKLESPVIPLSETLAIMNMMDQIQVKIGYLKEGK